MKVQRYLFKGFIGIIILNCFLYRSLIAIPLGFNFLEGKTTSEIPFTLYNNLIIVPVTLNKTIQLKFILDSGVRSSILLDNSVSKKLKLELGRKVNFAGPGIGNSVVGNVVNNVSLALNGVEGVGLGLVVLEKENHLFSKFGKTVHGILGYDIFTRFIVEIDYDTKLIKLYEPFVFTPDPMSEIMPLIVYDTKPYVQTHLKLKNGENLKRNLMIDTGASIELLLYPEANKDYNMSFESKPMALGRGLGGDIIGRSGKVRSLNIQDFEIKNILAHFPEKGSFYNIEGMTCHGTLGGGILKQFKVVFDYFNYKLYLKRVG